MKLDSCKILQHKGVPLEVPMLRTKVFGGRDWVSPTIYGTYLLLSVTWIPVLPSPSLSAQEAPSGNL